MVLDNPKKVLETYLWCLDKKPKRIIMAHGEVVESNVEAFLLGAFEARFGLSDELRRKFEW